MVPINGINLIFLGGRFWQDCLTATMNYYVYQTLVLLCFVPSEFEL